MKKPKLMHRNSRQHFQNGIDHGRVRSDSVPVWKSIVEDDDLWSRAEIEPQRLPWSGVWIYKDYEFDLEGLEDLPDEDQRILIIDAFDAERRKLEHLRAKFDQLKHENSRRPPIPESVRIVVWQRDSGRCVECHSRENLEFDHIIPISKGGSNTARNIQILCETCNRSKGARM